MREARQGGEGEATVSDLDAAVARLKRDLATPGTVTGCVVDGDHLRLLLADWERRGKDAEYVQNAVDTVVHYRNLAIKCGASPDDMLGVYDRKLCVDHNPDDRDGYDFSDNRETWAEVEKVTAERDAARAEVERLTKLNEDLLTYQELGGTCAYCKATHLKEEMPAHIEQCAKHPMAAMKAELARLHERDARARDLLEHASVHLGVATAGIAPVATARAALDVLPSLVGAALALLKETP